jgi:hypothetical protein
MVSMVKANGTRSTKVRDTVIWKRQGETLRLLGPTNTDMRLSTHEPSCSMCMPPRSGRWTFLCVCHRTCACICMKRHTCVCKGRSCRTGLGGGLTAAGKHAGRSDGGRESHKREPSPSTLHFHPFSPSSRLVNCGEWTEEIRAWVRESLGPAPFLWQPKRMFPSSLRPSPSPLFLGRQVGLPCTFATLWWPSGERQAKKARARKAREGTGGTRALGTDRGG